MIAAGLLTGPAIVYAIVAATLFAVAAALAAWTRDPYRAITAAAAAVLVVALLIR